jgi:hypothetical protein
MLTQFKITFNEQNPKLLMKKRFDFFSDQKKCIFNGALIIITNASIFLFRKILHPCELGDNNPFN